MTRGSRFAGSLLLGLAIAGSAATLVAAASAPPSSEPASRTGIEFWVDEPIPPSVPVGGSLEIGATLWSPIQHELANLDGLYLRLYPATGKAKPSTAVARSDWPGHVTGTVKVPNGGPGRIEIGFSGQECRDDGSGCKPVDLPLDSGGIGPPPEASRAQLVTAQVHLDPDEPVAGRPIDIMVEIDPRAPWSAGDLAIPDPLAAIFTRNRSADFTKVDLRMGPDGLYTGQVTLPDPGDYTVDIAIPARNGEDQPIERGTVRLRVVDAKNAPADAVLVAAEQPVPWPLIGGVLVVLVVLSIVVRRVFADL